MNRRGAISLIELLVIMSACTIALNTMGILMHRAMRIHVQSRAHVDAERTALRLSNQFRRDVHKASTAVARDADGDKNVFLRLEFEDGRDAEYSRDGGIVRRVEAGGGEPTWREEFNFPAIDELTIDEASSPRRLILTLVAKPGQRPVEGGKFSVGAIPVSLRVEAVVGRRLRSDGSSSGREATE